MAKHHWFPPGSPQRRTDDGVHQAGCDPHNDSPTARVKGDPRTPTIFRVGRVTLHIARYGYGFAPRLPTRRSDGRDHYEAGFAIVLFPHRDDVTPRIDRHLRALCPKSNGHESAPRLMGDAARRAGDSPDGHVFQGASIWPTPIIFKPHRGDAIPAWTDRNRGFPELRTHPRKQ